MCGTSWTYNPSAVTKVASSDGTAIGNSSGGNSLTLSLMYTLVDDAAAEDILKTLTKEEIAHNEQILAPLAESQSTVELMSWRIVRCACVCACVNFLL